MATIRFGTLALLDCPASGLRLLHAGEDQAQRDDLPLMPSLRKLLETEEYNHRTIFSVVPDEFDVDDLVRRTEALVGDFDQPDSGFLFVVPVSRVRGLHRKP